MDSVLDLHVGYNMPGPRLYSQLRSVRCSACTAWSRRRRPLPWHGKFCFHSTLINIVPRSVWLILLLLFKVLYLSTIYTRSELALRIGVLYTATSLSGAFGGKKSDNSQLPMILTMGRTSGSCSCRDRESRRSLILALDFCHRRTICEYDALALVCH